MAAEIASTVRLYSHCVLNCLPLIRLKQLMRLFPAKESSTVCRRPTPESVAKSEGRQPLHLLMADRFINLTQVVPMKSTTCVDVSRSL